jgi:hypothetical protein
LPTPNFRTDDLGYTYIDGYRYIGPVRVPPLPNRIAMFDRTTGIYGVLSHSGGVGSLSLAIAAVNAAWTDIEYYGINDGPYTGDYRLYLDDGNLLAEYAEGFSSRIILTRKAFDTTSLRIEVDPTDGTVTTSEYAL